MVTNDFDNTPIRSAVPQDHVIFTDFDGLEGVLVDLNTRKYYQLNETAALVWRGIERLETIENIAKEINTLYDVPVDRAALSVQRLLRSFNAYKLIRLT